MQGPDSVYDRAHPWQSNEERLVSEALSATAGPISPPVPRRNPFPDRFGYEKRALGIMDVLDISNSYPGARIDYAGNRSGMQGSSAPSLGVM